MTSWWRRTRAGGVASCRASIYSAGMGYSARMGWRQASDGPGHTLVRAARLLAVALAWPAAVSAALSMSAGVAALQAAEFRFDGLPLTVPDGFVVEQAAGPALVERPVTIALDDEGRLYVADSSGSNAPLTEQQLDPRHRVWRLEDVDGDGVYDRRTLFADGLMMLQGTLWHDGSLYVCAAPEILRFTDIDGDGVADERVVWHDGQTLTGCGNDLHGPYAGPDGRLYFTKGAFAEQRHDLVDRPGWTTRAAHVFRKRPDGRDLEVVLTGGMDNPVDVAFTATGERLLAATFLQRPADGRRDGVVHAVYGGVYGKDHGVLAGHERTGDLMPVLIHLSAAAACGIHVHSGFGLPRDHAGNAFVCSFNLRSVSRHVLVSDGAGFTARDEPFLTGDSGDFHPTDVIEDADGSLLIVDTGGWYRLCCPSSQLEKPAALGGIYRVRPATTLASRDRDDLRGQTLAWTGVGPEVLVRRLGDPRPVVVDRSMRTLARSADAAVGPLAMAIGDATSAPAARQAAVWTLARIDGDAARAVVRQALGDPAASVRHAAAHVAGLHRDPRAVPALVNLLTGDDAGGLRAAAEALGRIGGAEAVAAVLAACPRAAARPGHRAAAASVGPPDGPGTDRIAEHSLTYALIEAGLAPPVAAAVTDPDPRIRRAAVVAIDQMPLRHPGVVLPEGFVVRDHVVAACRDDDAGLRDAGLWLVSEHPEWADAVAGDVAGLLARITAARAAEPPRVDEADAIIARLARIADQPAIAAAIGASAVTDGTDSTIWAAAIDVMEAARPSSVPDAWVEGVAARLAAGSVAEVRVLAGLALSGPQRDRLRPLLLRIAADPTGLPAACTRAARAAGDPQELPEAVIQRLLAILVSGPTEGGAADVSPLDRAAAAELLAAAPISAEVADRLADACGSLPASDAAVLLAGLTARGGDVVGRAVAALADAARPEGLPRELLSAAIAAVPAEYAAVGRRLLDRVEAARGAEREAFERLVASLPEGDASRGHAVYFSNKSACTTCHALGYAGGRVGPDLTRIGGIRSPRDLLEAIVLPSASFVRSYEPVVVLTTDGRVFAGVLREENAAELMLQTSATATERIPRGMVESIDAGTVSIMPQGYGTLLSPQELADLVAFLGNAK